MLDVLFSLSIGLVFFLFFYYKDSPIGCAVRIPKTIPRADHLPVLGSALGLLLNYHRIYDWIVEKSEQYGGKPFAFQIPFSQSYVLSNDPTNLEHVLKKNFENYVKGPYFDENTRDVLGHGIFNSDGETWRLQRKTAASLFNVNNFRKFVEQVFKDEMLLFAAQLDKAASNKSIVDLQAMFFKFTLDGFVKVGFNCELKSMQADEMVPFAAAFDKAQTRLDWRFFFPFWRIQNAITGGGKLMKSYIETIQSFSKDIMTQRRASEESGHDLLSFFIELKDEDGLPLYDDDNELVFIILNFIIAGRDTTAQALSWCIYLLSQHPQVEQKLVEEIHQATVNDKPLSYETVKGMKYANAVFKETLRLYPSVPKNTKRALQDDVLPDGTFLPAGSQFAWSPYAQGRLKSIWGETAHQFNPDRWLQADDKLPSQFEYSVFNCGPRICLGKSMAELEGVFVLVSIIRNYRFQLVEPEKVTYANSLTLPMVNGLKTRVTLRNKQ